MLETVQCILLWIGGMVLVLGGMYLILRSKQYIDKEGNVSTEIEVPKLGKIKTNTPSMIIVIAGALLFALPYLMDLAKGCPQCPEPNDSDKSEIIKVKGTLTEKGEPLKGLVMVGIIPGNLTALSNSKDFCIDTYKAAGSYVGIVAKPQISGPPSCYMKTVSFDENGNPNFDFDL